MADRTITIDILANDFATAVFRNVKAGMNGLGSFSSSLYSGINNANKALQRYNATMQGFNNTVVNTLSTAGKAVYNFTTDSIKQFANLESQHAKTMGVLSANYDFNWTGPNTAEQQKNMEQFYRDSEALKQQAYKVGSLGPTGSGSMFDPTEISMAQTSLARAGISADDMLNTDIVNTIVKFAGGNDISIDDAVAFGVQLGAQFDKDPDEWGKMFDQVTYAANAAPIDVSDVMQSLKYVGNMAAGYDVPLSDVLSAIVIMGKSGLKGSQAGSGLNAIFTRSMNPTGVTTASKAPTKHVEDVYNDFKSKVVDEHGMFNGLEGYTEELQTALSGLTDEEMSWFNKKMFGMYQSKAALALGRTEKDADKTFGAIADAIVNESEGLNDAIYDLMVQSSGGQIEALGNAWTATKMRFGDSLSPVTKEVTKQLIQSLGTGKFNINFDSIRTSLDEAVKNTEEQFGPDVSGLLDNFGNLGIDVIQSGSAVTPLVGGSADALMKLLNGDFAGAWESLQKGISDTDEEIQKLPPELQDTAENLKNLILMFEGLFALNIVAKVAEILTGLGVLVGGGVGGAGKFAGTVWDFFAKKGKNGKGTAGDVISDVLGMTTTNMTVNAANVVVNGGNITGGNGGDVLDNLLDGGNKNSSGLVDVNGNPLKSSKTTNGVKNGNTSDTPLSSTNPTTLTILKKLGISALAIGALATRSPGMMSTADQRAVDGNDNIDKFVANVNNNGYSVRDYIKELNDLNGKRESGDISTSEYNRGIDKLKDKYANGDMNGAIGDAYVLYYAQGHEDYIDNGGSKTDRQLWEDQVVGREAARDEMMRLYTSMEGSQQLLDSIKNELASKGEISEDWLIRALTYEKNGYQYTGSNEDMLTIMRAIFPNFDATYKGDWNYNGRFNDSAIGKYFQKNFDKAEPDKLPSIDSLNSAADALNIAASNLANGSIIGSIAALYNGNPLSLNKGPLSQQGAMDYIMNQMTGNAGRSNRMMVPDILKTGSIANDIASRISSTMSGNSDSGSNGEVNTALSTIGADVSKIASNTSTPTGNAPTTTISLGDAINMLSMNNGFVLDLGKGPLSQQGAKDYMIDQLANGQAANQQLLQNIQNGISALDPTLTVDITNRAPQVKVDVKVNIDKNGNVTKNVVQNFGALDNWLFRASQRFGTTKRIER